MHYQNLFRLLINGKKRKGAIKIFIETIFKAQENQRFSILTKLKLRALKTLSFNNELFASLRLIFYIMH